MKKPSVHHKLFWLYSIPVLVLMLLLLICCGVSIYNLNSQMAQLDRSSLQTYVGQLETSLRSIEQNVQTFTTVDNDTTYMQYLPSETERLFATKRVFRRMEADVIEYPSMSGEFLYTIAQKNTLQVFGSNLSFEETQNVKQMIRMICSDPSQFFVGQWQYCQNGSSNYLLYGYLVDGVYFGFLIAPEKLMDVPFVESDIVQVRTSLYLNGQLISGEGATSTSNMISAQIGSTGLALCVQVKQVGLANGIVWLSLLMALIPAMLLVNLLLLYRFARRQIMTPIEQITATIQKAGSGDMEARVDTSGMLQEFVLIADTFNDTVTQIADLRKRETEILREKQISQLHNLQMQINPHFLGNCLNAVYNASLTGDYEQVLALTTYLNRYFRFMAQLEHDFVSLEEELRFTEDFLSIQKLRFGDVFSYNISVPVFLRQAVVPPSVLKSFAENSVKHARGTENQAKIEIRASMLTANEATQLKLEILDNGPGFSEDILLKLSQKGQPYFDDRVHIGIANVRQRLDLLYLGKAQLMLENLPDGGAHVTVILPLSYCANQQKESRPI